MTNVKHTPAPWLVGEDQCIDECWSIVTTSGGAIIANVNDQAARQANARLIAAAPDLLAALESLVPQLCEGVEDGCGKLSRHDCAACEGFAAIAKARGQS